MEINITGYGQVEPGDCIGYYQPSDSHLTRQKNETWYISYIISTDNSLDDFFANNSIQNITLQPAITVAFGKYTHDGWINALMVQSSFISFTFKFVLVLQLFVHLH